jgi:hypothetical protein
LTSQSGDKTPRAAARQRSDSGHKLLIPRCTTIYHTRCYITRDEGKGCEGILIGDDLHRSIVQHTGWPTADSPVTMRRRTTPRPRWGPVRLQRGPTDPPRHLTKNTSAMTGLKLATTPSEIPERNCRPHGDSLRMPRSHARAIASRDAPGTPVGPGSCPRMRSMMAATPSGYLSSRLSFPCVPLGGAFEYEN